MTCSQWMATTANGPCGLHVQWPVVKVSWPGNDSVPIPHLQLAVKTARTLDLITRKPAASWWTVEVKNMGPFSLLFMLDLDSNYTWMLCLSANCTCGMWTKWSDCSHTCGGGIQLRERDCVAPKYMKDMFCDNDKKESRLCRSEPCPSKSYLVAGRIE